MPPTLVYIVLLSCGLAVQHSLVLALEDGDLVDHRLDDLEVDSPRLLHHRVRLLSQHRRDLDDFVFQLLTLRHAPQWSSM